MAGNTIDRRSERPDTRPEPREERRRMSDEAPPQKGLKFDPTINAGHLITFAGFLLTMALGWSALDKRVVVLEESRKAQVQTDQHQDVIHRANIDAMRDSLTEIKQGIRELSQRLESRK